MNKSDAKKISEIITNEELADMFANAKANIIDWTKVSNVNKGMSKGTAWNILASDFDINKIYHNLTKYNMIREFGEFIPNHLKPIKKIKVAKPNVIHQEPIFK